MEKFSCRECGEKFSIKEISEAKDTCPKCGKETSWLSAPVFFGFDDEEEE